MDTIYREIKKLLSSDMLSHGLFMQCVQQATPNGEPVYLRAAAILEELLSSGTVEIGSVRLVSPDYVEFVAWKGPVKERLARAKQAVESAREPDNEFAYWLCLRQNVDRYEDDEPTSAP